MGMQRQVQGVAAHVEFPVGKFVGISAICTALHVALQLHFAAVDVMNFNARFEALLQLCAPLRVCFFAGEWSGDDDGNVRQVLLRDCKHAFVNGITKSAFEKRAVSVVGVELHRRESSLNKYFACSIDVQKCGAVNGCETTAVGGLAGSWRSSYDV